MKALIRTNIKLSGNIKITVGDKGSTLLVGTLDSLERSESIQAGTSFPQDVSTLSKILGYTGMHSFGKSEFELPVTESDTRYLSSSYGCLRNEDFRIKDDFRIFAPLWVEKELPKYFLIYKCRVMYKDLYETIKSSTLIEQYNLTSGSLGKYLSSITHNKDRKELPVYFNVKSKEMTYFGIDTKTGVFTSKTEPLKDSVGVVTLDDEQIISGFERLGLISTSVLNLEFGFSDESDDTGKWIYFGVYSEVEEVEEVVIDTEKTLENLKIPHTKNIVPFGLEKVNKLVFRNEIKKEKGIQIIKSEDDLLYDFYKNEDGSCILETPMDISPLPKVSIPSEYDEAKGSFGFLEVVGELDYGDSVYIRKNGTIISEIIADDLPLVQEHTSGKATDMIFNHRGTKAEITKAIAQAIRNTLDEDSTLEVVELKENILIRELYFSTHKWEIISTTENIKTVNLSGGGKDDGSRAVIPVEHSTKISKDDFLLTKDGYSEVMNITSSINDVKIVDSVAVSIENEKDSIYYAVEGHEILHEKGMLTPYRKPKTVICTLKPLSMVDFAFFQTEDTENLKTEHTDFYAIKEIKENERYFVFGNGSIAYNRVRYSTGSSFIGVRGYTSYRVIEGTPTVVPEITNNDLELKTFPGLSKIEGDKHKSRHIEYSEYSILEERKLRELLYKNKVYPYICRWNIKTSELSTNVVPRISTNLTHGVSMGIPSITTKIPTPELHTHEWYHIGGTKQKGASYFKDKFSVLDFTKTPGYFENYYLKNKATSGYSVVDSEGNVFFRGVHLNVGKNFAGYKFSVLLQVNNELLTPLKHSILINEDDRAIQILSEVTLEDYKVEGGLSYSLLYMIKSLKTKHSDGKIKYGKKLRIPNTGGVDFIGKDNLYGVELYNKVTGVNYTTGFLQFSSPLQIKDCVKENDNKDYGTLIGYTSTGTLVSTNDNTEIGDKYRIQSDYGKEFPMITSVEKTGIITKDYSGKNLYFISDFSFPVLRLSTFEELKRSVDLRELKWIQVSGGKEYYSKIMELISASTIIDALTSGIKTDYSSFYKISGGESVPISPIKMEVYPAHSMEVKKEYFTEEKSELIPTLSTTVSYFEVKSKDISGIKINRVSGWGIPEFKEIISFKKEDRDFSWNDLKHSDGTLKVKNWKTFSMSWNDLLSKVKGTEITSGETFELTEYRKSMRKDFKTVERIYPELGEYSLEKTSVVPTIQDNIDVVEKREYLCSKWYKIPRNIKIENNSVVEILDHLESTITLRYSFLSILQGMLDIEDKDILKNILRLYKVTPVIYGLESVDTEIEAELGFEDILNAGYTEYKIHTRQSPEIGEITASIKSGTNLRIYTTIKLHRI
jgi:hypothetical protein|nr:MAG TPA: hypothetical protein [Caudoviricetes sp.]